jgi:hypothetical protein
MAKKVNVKPTDFSKYFKGLDLKKRIRVMETATRLLKVQKEDAKILADAPPLPMEAEKEGLG